MKLRELAAAGVGLVVIAETLERSTASVRRQAERQRISLRRAGERRGAIIGELARERLPRDLREAVFLGVSDPVVAERRVTSTGDLCPSCARRHVETRTGLCAPCHLRRLAEAHREELAIVAGRRELDAARALKYRARRASR